MFVAKRPARCATSSQRPKGLWKAKSQARVVPVIGKGQRQASPSRSPLLPPSSLSGPPSSTSSWSSTLISWEEDEDLLEELSSSSSSASTSSSFKRRRVELDCGDENQYEDPDQIYLWDYSSFRPSSTSAASMRTKKVSIALPTAGPSTRIPRQRVYSSIDLPAQVQEGDDEFTWEDWEELQSMFSPFENDFDADVATVTQYLPTLRAIIHECQRFLSLHPNPSPFFLQHSSPTPPTVVYTIFGHALFLFGLIISAPASAPEMFDTEPKLPASYWFAALDVFALGDSSAVQEADGSSVDVEVDWKMSLTWGMTMVRLSREVVEGRNIEPCSSSHPGSPLDFITVNRPPHTPSSTTPEVKDLLKYAMDQITRGIFHMPRLPSSPLVPNTPSSTFISLLSIATEVLRVASQLMSPSDRVYWLRWGDSLFSSATAGTMSAATTSSSTSLGAPLSDTPLASSSAGNRAAVAPRGRCNLLLARALIEAGAGVGEDEKEWMEEIKDTLQDAIEFLEESLGPEIQTLAGSKRKRVDVEEEEEREETGAEGEKMLREARELLERYK